jgi:hypothetical protein
VTRRTLDRRAFDPHAEVDGVDVGLAQIRAGLAIAGSDSLDSSFGSQPRQAQYRAADAGSPDVCPMDLGR